ncbi:hypothetical protein Q5530_34545, partial [Saccharothrix sp. BKS2]
MPEPIRSGRAAFEGFVEGSPPGARDPRGRGPAEAITGRVEQPGAAAYPPTEPPARGAGRAARASGATGPLPAPTAALGRGVSWPGNSLLGRLRESTRQELLEIGTVVRYTADREVMEQDAKDTHVLLLLDGVVKVQTTDETG